MPRFDPSGRVVLITGAGRGLGALLARELASRGASIAVVDVSHDAARAVARELGDRALALGCDVTSLDAVEAAVRATVERFGRLDVAVANAGITAFGSVEGIAPAEFRRVIDVNLVGAWNTLRAAVPGVRETRGYLLVTASMAMAVHSPLQAQYTASKAGVEAVANCLRQELRPDGVDVGVVYPTFAATDLMKQTHGDPLGAKLWGGNRGPFAMVSPELVVEGMLEAIEGRKARVVVPKHLAPLVLAPGVFRPLMEWLIRRYGGARAISAARDLTRVGSHT